MQCDFFLIGMYNYVYMSNSRLRERDKKNLNSVDYKNCQMKNMQFRNKTGFRICTQQSKLV